MENKGSARAIQVGLGPIGRGVTRYLSGRSALTLVGAFDLDPEIIGQDAGLLAGLDRPLGVAVRGPEDLPGPGEADIAFLTTGSSLEKIAPQLRDLVSRGLNVVSSCEELAWPWRTQPGLSAELDALAREKGVSILGTGVNPGFLMDFLPVAVTAVSQSVESVLVERIQDAGLRRVPFQKKIGAGLERAEFEKRAAAGKIRHVGLTESMHLVGALLGWDIESTEDIVEPVIARSDFSVDGRVLAAAGAALGVNQVGRAFCGSREVIRLVFRAALAEPESYDRIVIEGEPPIDLKVTNGINGDLATCAIIVNAGPALVRAPAGLRTMADAGLVCFQR